MSLPDYKRDDGCAVVSGVPPGEIPLLPFGKCAIEMAFMLVSTFIVARDPWVRYPNSQSLGLAGAIRP
jgi:hypothetical protein